MEDQDRKTPDEEVDVEGHAQDVQAHDVQDVQDVQAQDDDFEAHSLRDVQDVQDVQRGDDKDVQDVL